jgi:hypothetical protein
MPVVRNADAESFEGTPNTGALPHPVAAGDHINRLAYDDPLAEWIRTLEPHHDGPPAEGRHRRDHRSSFDD